MGVTVATAGFTTGCAVGRGQETTGAYVDDTVITTEVKAKFASDPVVAATSISVETLNGTVQLRGFAKSSGGEVPGREHRARREGREERAQRHHRAALTSASSL